MQQDKYLRDSSERELRGRDELLFEDVPACVLCGSTSSEFLFPNFDRYNRLPGSFGIVQCEGCTLVRLSPRPTADSIGYYYPEADYYSYRPSGNAVDSVESRKGLLGILRDSVRKSVLERLGYPVGVLSRWEKFLQPFVFRVFLKQATYGWKHRFPRYVSNGRALDIGCGNGTFLSFLKAHGWQVNGIEISEAAAKVAKEHFDIDVYIGNVRDAPFDDKSFDFINMSHVLEHVYDPTEVLRKVRKLLRDDGTVYLEIPNYDSTSRRFFGEYWFPWETPRHLFMYSPSTIRRQIKAAGFELVRIETKLEDQYGLPFRYQLEEKLGSKLDDDFKLPLFMRLRRTLIKSWIHATFIVRPLSGDFIGCWLRASR